jgi:hypothetical protein
MILPCLCQDYQKAKTNPQAESSAWQRPACPEPRVIKEPPQREGSIPQNGRTIPKDRDFTHKFGSQSVYWEGRRPKRRKWDSNPAKFLVQNGLLCVILTLGCTPVAPTLKGKESFLARPQMNPGSCAVEIFFVRFPVGSPVGNEDLWREVDETRVPAETRQLLWANGLRVGVVGIGLTPAVVSLLGLKGSEEGDKQDLPPVSLAGNLTVAKRHLQLPPRERREVLLGPIAEHLTLLVAEKRGVRGRTFEQGQPVLALMWSPLSHGRICLQVTPEVTFGQPQTRYSAIEGHFRLDVVRPRESFLDLQVAVPLNPGEMLVVGCAPDRPGTLGYRFFVQETDQKVVIFRPSQIQHDDLFCPEEFSRLAGASSP